MATTENGIYYQDNYNELADILADNKKMAESIDLIYKLLNNKYNEQIKNIASSEPQNAEIVDARQRIRYIRECYKTKSVLF